jgi:hypothetical protein
MAEHAARLIENREDQLNRQFVIQPRLVKRNT